MRNNHRRALYALAFCLLSITASAQTLWRQSTERVADSLPSANHYAVFEVDLAALQSSLRKAPKENSRGASASITIPKPSGETISFLIEETALFAPTNAAQRGIKTYTGRTANGAFVLHLTVSGGNIQGIITGASETWFVASPRANTTGKPLVEVYDLQGRPFGEQPPGCTVDGESLTLPNAPTNNAAARTPSRSCPLKIYRLAIAGTADYTGYFGSATAAFANTVALINNVNAIYERDLGVRFVLVTNETHMYTDAATDPFTNSGASPCSELAASISNFNATVGNSAFDLGVTVYGQNFGGCAYVGVTCNASLKGGSTGGYSSPTPTSYLLEVVAHEIGHQFNAGHTHNATGNGCTISTTNAFEPGGGSTIMAYKSACSPSFAAGGNTLYFHGGSLEKMRNYIASAATCYTTGAANTSPLLTAPTDGTFYIPVSTPFRLDAEATDAEDQGTLTYTFDQVDLGTGSATVPTPTTASGPVFRSFAPTDKPYRYLPRLDSVVAGITPQFESLPAVARTLRFYTTVRDNRPGCGCQSVDTINVATVSGAPFRVTSLGAASTLTTGSTITITWDVAGTAASPFNVAAVQLLFAADGLNYNTVLLASTPNDGSETITLPNISATAGRVMVAAIGNLFFDVNDAAITLQAPCGDVQRNQLYPEARVDAVQGSAALQLSQSAAFGIGSDGFDGEITAADPTGILGFRASATDATCSQGTGFSGRYQATPFYTTVPGTYTLSRTAGTLTGSHYYSLYGAGGYNATNVCNNFLYSNVWFTGGGSISFGSSFTYALAGNTAYNLAFEVRSTTTYGTYRFNVRGPGPVYTEFKNPGNVYSYVIVNSSGVIVAVTAAPDLRSYAAGTYYVYGVSHSTAVNLGAYINQSFNNVLYGAFSSSGCVSVSNNRREVVVRASATLPLTYVQLTATAEGAATRLRWKVSDEADAAGAVVEHSADGVLFAPVATLAMGQGRVAAAEFGYHHRTPSGGRNYYRIKQLARSGGALYSNTAMVELETKPLITVTPNPTSGQVVVSSFGQGAFVPFVLRLYDNKGQQVKQYLVNQRVYSIDLSALPSGLYLAVGDGFSEKVLKR